MATRTKNRADLLHFDRGDDWVSPYEAKQKNAASKVDAAIEAMLSSGEVDSISEAERQRMIQQVVATGNFDLQRAPKADFSNVQSQANTVPQTDPWGSVMPGLSDMGESLRGILGDAVVGGVKSSLGGRIEMNKALGDPLGSEANAALYDALNFEGGGSVGALLRQLSGDTRTADRGQELFNEGQAQINRSVEQARTEKPVGSIASTAISDFGSSPSSLLSLVGGPAAAYIAGSDTAAREFAGAVAAGVPVEEALKRASAQGTAEAVPSMIPAGKLLEKVPFLGKKIKSLAEYALVDNVGKVAAVNTLKTVAGEVAEEEFTTLSQMAADKIMSQHASDPELRRYAAEQLPKNKAQFADAVIRTAAASALGAGALSSPIDIFSSVHEAAKQATRLDKALDNSIKTRDVLREFEHAAKHAAQTANQPEQMGLLPEAPASTPAFDQQEAQRQKDLEIEAGLQIGRRRTQAEDARAANLQTRRRSVEDELGKANQQLEMLQNRIENGDTSSATLASAAAANRRVRQAQNILNNMPETAPVVAEQPTPTPTPTAPATEPQQLPLDIPITKEQQAEIDKQKSYEAEATKTVLDDKKNINKTATTARGKARRAHILELNQQLRDLPTEVRVAQTAAAMKQWDETNPLSAFLEAAKTPPAPKTRKRIKSKKVKEDTNAAFADLASTLSKQGQDPLASNFEEEAANKASLEDVRSTLAGQEGTSLGRRVSELVNTGTHEFVETVDHIPTGDNQPLANGKGYYVPKTGKVYIVAGQLNKDNIKGDLLQVLAHETKHGADVGGSQELRGNFRNLVGDKANTNIVNQIRNLAKQDTAQGKRAKQIVDRVEATVPKEDWNLELPAYFISEAMDGTSGIGRSIFSPVKAAFRRMTGSDNLNLSDLKYAANQLVREVAAKGETFTPTQENVVPKGLILANGKSASIKLGEGKTWLSFDGKRKYEISDSKSSITIPDNFEGRVFNAEDILHHPDLYFERPELMKGVDIEFKDTDPRWGAEAYGPVDGRLGKIVINTNSHYWDDANPARYDGDIHRAIVHEMQHIVQELDKTTPGASPDQFLSKEERKLKQEVEDTRAALQAARDMDENNPWTEALEKELTRIDDKYTQAYEVAKEKYLSVLGEREAYRAQENIQRTQGEIDEERPGSHELKYTTEKYGVLNAKGKRLDKSGVKPLGQVTVPRDMAELEEASNTGLRIARRLLTPDMGYGHILNEMRINSNGWIAQAALKGDNLGREYNSAIKKNAKTLKIPVDKFKEQLLAKLDVIDAMPDMARRRAAVDALDRQWPGVGTAINRVRDFKWQLSQTIIAQRREDSGRDITPKELATFQKIVNQAETYNTRAYLTQLGGEAGTRYARSVLRRARKNPDSPDGRKLARFIEYLIDKQLTIPDQAALQELPMGQVRAMYDTWVGDGSNFKGVKGKARMIAALADVEEVSRPELEAKALEIARELMGDTQQVGPVAKYIRGGKQDRTILESRKDIPVELRELMGELRDPFLREMLTIARQTQFIGKTRLLNEIAKTGKGKWFTEARTEGFDNKLSSPAFGPLNGKYVTKDVYDLLTDVSLYQASMDQALANALHKPDFLAKHLAGGVIPLMNLPVIWQKFNQLIASPAAMMLNFGSAPFILTQAGNLNPTNVGRGLKNAAGVVASSVSHTNSPKALRDRQELLFAQVLDSSVVGAYQGKLYKDIFAEVNRLRMDDQFMGRARQIVSKHLAQNGRTGVTLLRETFAFMDVWAKVANYYDRKDFLTNYYKANGETKTPEQIMRQAGYETSLTNISYGVGIPAIKMIERNIPFAMYLTYFSEVPRSLAFSYAQVYRDAQMAKNATTKEARNLAFDAALRRMIGTSLVTGGLTAALVSMLDSADDDEKRKRKLDPPWEANSIKVVIGQDKNGNDVTFNIGRFDHNGPLNEAIQAVIMAKQGDKAETLMDAVTGLFVESKGSMRVLQVFSDLIAATVGSEKLDARSDMNTILMRNNPKLASQVKGLIEFGDLSENIEAALEVFIPAPITPLFDKERTAVTTGHTGVATVLRHMGYKAYVRDPDKNFSFRAIDYSQGMSNLAKERNELLGNIDGIGTDEVVSRLNDLVQQEHKLFDNLYDAYDGYKAFGKSTKDAYAILKSKKISPEKVNGLRYGRFEPHVANKDVIKKWFQGQIKKNPDKKEELRQNYKMLMQVYGKES